MDLVDELIIKGAPLPLIKRCQVSRFLRDHSRRFTSDVTWTLGVSLVFAFIFLLLSIHPNHTFDNNLHSGWIVGGLLSLSGGLFTCLTYPFLRNAVQRFHFIKDAIKELENLEEPQVLMSAWKKAYGTLWAVTGMPICGITLAITAFVVFSVSITLSYPIAGCWGLLIGLVAMLYPPAIYIKKLAHLCSQLN